MNYNTVRQVGTWKAVRWLLILGVRALLLQFSVTQILIFRDGSVAESESRRVFFHSDLQFVPRRIKLSTPHTVPGFQVPLGKPIISVISGELNAASGKPKVSNKPAF